MMIINGDAKFSTGELLLQKRLSSTGAVRKFAGRMSFLTSRRQRQSTKESKLLQLLILPVSVRDGKEPKNFGFVFGSDSLMVGFGSGSRTFFFYCRIVFGPILTKSRSWFGSCWVRVLSRLLVSI